MDKKYELTDETRKVNGKTLYKIKAIKDFEPSPGVTIQAGEIGGFIESEDNLSQKGNCWVADNACVYDWARVCDNALVCDNAIICKFATVADNATVCNHVTIEGEAMIIGNVIINGYTQIGGSACIM